jgi:hypothetical protein
MMIFIAVDITGEVRAEKTFHIMAVHMHYGSTLSLNAVASPNYSLIRGR